MTISPPIVPAPPRPARRPTAAVVREPRRPGLGTVLDALAVALLWVLLLLPYQPGPVTVSSALRIPVEGPAAVAVLAALPGRPRRVVATVAGAVLGVLTVLKALDAGFLQILVRPFDLVLDRANLRPAVEFVNAAAGPVGVAGAALGVLLLTALVIAAPAFAARRTARLAAANRSVAVAAVAGLAVLAAALGGPFAAHRTATLVHDHTVQVRSDLRDQHEFRLEAANDPYARTPGDQLLTGLRGKDVLLAFVESYGRSAVEGPAYASAIDAQLDSSTKLLALKGFHARSGWLTSPTAGGGSWLAHSTLLSGLWIDNQQRYRTLVASDRLTLNGAFHRADWRTVGVMPGVQRAWPEGAFYGFDKLYGDDDLGYRGPRFSWATMPDQFALAAYRRAEVEGRAAGAPSTMTELPLVSSHAPWAPVPSMVRWKDVGDGSVFGPMAASGRQPDRAFWNDSAKMRAGYRQAIDYSLQSLISYVNTYGDDDTVLVFLGDHQPVPRITGDNAGRDVPITILARDPAVLTAIDSWNWDVGLRPQADAPVWRMDQFRDRFLSAYGPVRTGG